MQGAAQNLHAEAVTEADKVAAPVEKPDRRRQEIQFEVARAVSFCHLPEGSRQMRQVSGIPQFKRMVMLTQRGFLTGKVLQFPVIIRFVIQKPRRQPQPEGHSPVADVLSRCLQPGGKFGVVRYPLAAETAAPLPAVIDLNEIGLPRSRVRCLSVSRPADLLFIYIPVVARP